jgi:hypothetical protein
MPFSVWNSSAIQFDDALVEVIAAQVGITVGGQNLGNAVAHLDDGDIEGAAAQVVDHDLLVFFLIDAVCQRSGSRLVDDTLDVQTGNGACVLGGLTLAVVEVSRNGDDGLGDRLAQISLGAVFETMTSAGRRTRSLSR